MALGELGRPDVRTAEQMMTGHVLVPRPILGCDETIDAGHPDSNVILPHRRVSDMDSFSRLLPIHPC